jgi:hypothetical protein
MDLNRDVQQVLFEILPLPEKYNYYLYCRENRLLEELRFVCKYFNSLHDLSRQGWTELLIEHPNLNEEILIEYREKLDWYIVCLYQNISEGFMDKWHSYINWAPISLHRKLSDEFIIRHQCRLNWSYLSNSGNLSENIVRKFENRIDWRLLVVNNYSINFLKKYQDEINWHEAHFEDMKTYEIFEEYIDWERLSYHEELTESFMRRFQDKLHWGFISSHQKLSKCFISEFRGKLNMESINRFIDRSQTTPQSSIRLPLVPPSVVRQRRYSRLRRRRRGIRLNRTPRPSFFEDF